MALFQHHTGTSIRHLALFARECWLLPIVVLATLVDFHDVTKPVMWTDEALSVLLSAYSPALICFHTAQDVHPPLYFLLLHGWMTVFGTGVFALRAMSVLAGVVTVVLSVWLVSLIASRRAAILAGLLLALLPISVRYSQEVRMYSLQDVWLMGATIALIYWVKNPQRYRYLVMYTLLMTAGFYTHYFAGLCVVAHWLYLSLLRFQPSKEYHLVTRPSWWLANGAVVFLYVPWIPDLIGQLSDTVDIGYVLPPTGFTLPSAIWQFLTLEDGRDLSWPIYVALPLGILGASGWIVLRDRGLYRFNTLVVIYAFVPMLVVFLISFKQPFFVPRYLSFAAIGLPLILAITLDRLAPRFPWLAIVCLTVLVGLEGGGLYNVYMQRNKLNDPLRQQNDHTDKVVDEINKYFVSGDRIVVDGDYWYMSVIYYNTSGTQPLLYTPPLPDGSSGRPDSDGAGTLFYQNPDKNFLDSLEVLPPETRRVWLLSDSDAEDLVQVPDNWQPVRTMKAGDTQVRLYSIHRQDLPTTASVRTER